MVGLRWSLAPAGPQGLPCPCSLGLSWGHLTIMQEHSQGHSGHTGPSYFEGCGRALGCPFPGRPSKAFSPGVSGKVCSSDGVQG